MSQDKSKSNKPNAPHNTTTPSATGGMKPRQDQQRTDTRKDWGSSSISHNQNKTNTPHAGLGNKERDNRDKDKGGF